MNKLLITILFITNTTALCKLIETTDEQKEFTQMINEHQKEIQELINRHEEEMKNMRKKHKQMEEEFHQIKEQKRRMQNVVETGGYKGIPGHR